MGMENYQIVGLLTGIVGIVIGFIVMLSPLFPLGILMIVVNVIAIVLVLGMRPKLNQKNEPKLTGLGITLIALGVFASWLLIIPGVLALKYKPQPQTRFGTT